MEDNIRCYVDANGNQHYVGPGNVPIIVSKDGAATMLGRPVTLPEPKSLPCLTQGDNGMVCNQLPLNDCTKYSTWCENNNNQCTARTGTNVQAFLDAVQTRKEQYSRLQFIENEILGTTFKELTPGLQVAKLSTLFNEKQQAIKALQDNMRELQKEVGTNPLKAKMLADQEAAITALTESAASNQALIARITTERDQLQSSQETEIRDRESLQAALAQAQAKQAELMRRLQAINVDDKQLLAQKQKYTQDVTLAARQERQLKEEMGRVKLNMAKYQELASRLQVEKNDLRAKIESLKQAEQMLRGNMVERTELLTKKELQLQQAHNKALALDVAARKQMDAANRELTDYKTRLVAAENQLKATTQNLRLVQTELRNVVQATDSYKAIMDNRVEAMRLMTAQIQKLNDTIAAYHQDQTKKEAVMADLVQQLRENESVRRRMASTLVGDRDFEALASRLKGFEQEVVQTVRRNQIMPADVTAAIAQQAAAAQATTLARAQDEADRRNAAVNRRQVKRAELERQQRTEEAQVLALRQTAPVPQARPGNATMIPIDDASEEQVEAAFQVALQQARQGERNAANAVKQARGLYNAGFAQSMELATNVSNKLTMYEAHLNAVKVKGDHYQVMLDRLHEIHSGIGKNGITIKDYADEIRAIDCQLKANKEIRIAIREELSILHNRYAVLENNACQSLS